MGLIVPPPAPPMDTRNPTIRAVSTVSLKFIKAALPILKEMLAPIWYDRNITPAQAITNLGTGATTAFAEYSTLATALVTGATAAGITLNMIDQTQPATAIVAPAMPDGWTPVPSPSNDGTMTLTPPPATVPAGLTLAAVTTLPGKVTVSWTRVVGGLSYSIQRSEDAGTSFQEVFIAKAEITGGGQVVVTDITEWTDVDTLPSGTQYRISVTTPAGTSAYSDPVTL